MAITPEERQAIDTLATQGISLQEIARQVGLTTGQVRGRLAYINRKPQVIGKPIPATLVSPAIPGQPAGSVSELIDGVDKLYNLTEKIRKDPDDETKPGTISELVQGVKELHDLSFGGASGPNGNGEFPGAQDGLLQFLASITAQQDKSSQALITQLQTQHANALERLDREHDKRMEELKLKLDKEQERDRSYWERMDGVRKGEQEQRDKLLREQQELVTDKLTEVSEKAGEHLKHAEELISARQDASERLIGASERHAEQVAGLRKQIGGDGQTKELVELAINRIADPIVRRFGQAEEGSPLEGGKNLTASKGADMLGGVGKRIKGAILNSFGGWIKEGLDQAVKHLQRWPDVPIDAIADLLWGARMFSDVGTYAQAACTFVTLNDLDEFLGKAGEYITGNAREAFASKKASEWWKALQDAIVERMRQEKAARQEYAQAQQGEGKQE